MSGYLPDGCTQEDCDRAAGGYEPDDRCPCCEDDPCQCCDECGGNLKRACSDDCDRQLYPTPQPPKHLKKELSRMAIAAAYDEECPF